MTDPLLAVPPDHIGLSGVVRPNHLGILLGMDGYPLCQELALHQARQALLKLLCDEPMGRA